MGGYGYWSSPTGLKKRLEERQAVKRNITIYDHNDKPLKIIEFTLPKRHRR